MLIDNDAIEFQQGSIGNLQLEVTTSRNEVIFTPRLAWVSDVSTIVQIVAGCNTRTTNHIVTRDGFTHGILSTCNRQVGLFCSLRILSVTTHLQHDAVTSLQTGNPHFTATDETDVTVAELRGGRIVFIEDTQLVGFGEEHQTLSLFQHVSVIAFHVIDALEYWFLFFLQIHIGIEPVSGQTVGLVYFVVELRRGILILSYIIYIGEEVPFLHLLAIGVVFLIGIHHAQQVVVGISALHGFLCRIRNGEHISSLTAGTFHIDNHCTTIVERGIVLRFTLVFDVFEFQHLALEVRFGRSNITFAFNALNEVDSLMVSRYSKVLVRFRSMGNSARSLLFVSGDIPQRVETESGNEGIRYQSDDGMLMCDVCGQGAEVVNTTFIHIYRKAIEVTSACSSFIVDTFFRHGRLIITTRERTICPFLVPESWCFF